jgi:3-mercaptopyruvate sulfurtransferase SseA
MTKSRFILIISFLLLIASACSAPAATPTNIPTLTPATIPLTEADVPRVSLEDAKAAFDNGLALFVDVRNKDVFRISHITGAYLITLQEFETRPETINLPKDQWIITYCT